VGDANGITAPPSPQDDVAEAPRSARDPLVPALQNPSTELATHVMQTLMPNTISLIRGEPLPANRKPARLWQSAIDG